MAGGLLWDGKGDLHPKHRLTRYHDWFTSRISSDEVVVDLGCGTGALAYDLALVAKKVVGIDIREASIAQARQSYSRPNLEFVTGDATDIDFVGIYDCAVLSNVLEHLEDRTDLLRRLGQAGMKVLIRVPAWDRNWWVPAREELGLDSRLDPTHRIEYTAESLRAELSAAGLAVHEFHRMWSEFYVDARREHGSR
jgi:SAM-dependent methyltransferase